jgi:hypothetical protein
MWGRARLVVCLLAAMALRPAAYAGAADATAVTTTATAGTYRNTLSLNAGGAMMVNTKNGLHPAASDVGVAWTRPGEWGGFKLEINYVAFYTAYSTDNLFGLRAAWTLRLPRRTLYPFATIGAGLYLSDVTPVLPIGQLGLGVERDFPNRLRVSFAVEGWGSLFALGFNPRLAVGYAF